MALAARAGGNSNTVTLRPPRSFTPSGAVFFRRTPQVPYFRTIESGANVPLRCSAERRIQPLRDPLDGPPFGGFSSAAPWLSARIRLQLQLFRKRQRRAAPTHAHDGRRGYFPAQPARRL
jgi:hypothetical protein